MARKAQPPPEPQTLVARIESFEQTYYISEYRQHAAPVQDEAIIEIVGRIERISPKLKQHLDQPIDISLACSRGFDLDDPTPPSDNPFLLPMRLSKRQRSCMAYVPAAAFWSIPNMIDTGRITHIEARFEPLHRGDGDLLSLYFLPVSKLAEL